MHATLDEFLDRQRTGLASTYLTRLKVGPGSSTRPRFPGCTTARCDLGTCWPSPSPASLALAAAIGVTPVGQEWADAATPAVTDAVTTLIDRVQGLF